MPAACRTIRGARRLLAMELALRRTPGCIRSSSWETVAAANELQARWPDAILLGAVPHADMPHVLASADLFVYASEAISTNLAVLEAQASGLPVVVVERGSARKRVGIVSGRLLFSR